MQKYDRSSTRVVLVCPVRHDTEDMTTFLHKDLDYLPQLVHPYFGFVRSLRKAFREALFDDVECRIVLVACSLEFGCEASSLL